MDEVGGAREPNVGVGAAPAGLKVAGGGRCAVGSAGGAVEREAAASQRRAPPAAGSCRARARGPLKLSSPFSSPAPPAGQPTGHPISAGLHKSKQSSECDGGLVPPPWEPARG